MRLHLKALLPSLSLGLLLATPLATLAITPIRRLEFNQDQLDPKMKVLGNIVDGVRWTDASGENFLLLSETGTIPSRIPGTKAGAQDALLYIHHFILANGQVTRGQGVMDGRTNAMGGLRARFLPGSITLTDIDSDGIAESMVAYKVSQVLPAERGSEETRIYFKVTMLEGNDRYVASGVQSLPHGGYKAEMAINETVRASAVLRAALAKHWKQYAKEAFEKY